MSMYNKDDLKQLANVELCNDTKRYDELSDAEFERLFVTFQGSSALSFKDFLSVWKFYNSGLIFDTFIKNNNDLVRIYKTRGDGRDIRNVKTIF